MDSITVFVSQSERFVSMVSSLLLLGILCMIFGSFVADGILRFTSIFLKSYRIIHANDDLQFESESESESDSSYGSSSDSDSDDDSDDEYVFKNRKVDRRLTM